MTQSVPEITVTAATTARRGLVSGPVLRFKQMDVNENMWSGSVLIVINQCTAAPMSISCPEATMSIEPLHLFQYSDYQFIRYDFSIKMSPTMSQQVDYTLKVDGEEIKKSFFVPSAEEKWRFMFFSCNGFCTAESERQCNGIQPLWRDVMKKHQEKPYHAMIGGGDQLYSDDVFEQPEVRKWIKMDGHHRKHAPWSDALDSEVNKYYFWNYANHFSADVFADALASIPNVFILDDHDIFDGFGSYPDGLQNCAVFQNIGRIAFLFYLLFQHHTTPERAREDGLWGSGQNGGYSFLKRFGKDMIVLGLDTRRERSLDQVMSDETWAICQEKLKSELVARPNEIKHLISIMAIPIVYPRMEQMDSFTEGLRNFQKKAGKWVKTACKKLGMKKNIGRSLMSRMHRSNIFRSIAGHFGPELLDDIIDHWTHRYHTEERQKIVEYLQQLAVDHGLRTTFISGDVHCCSAGLFYGSANSVDVEQVEKLADQTKNDPLTMFQITSSAIANAAPPNVVLSGLHKNCIKYQLNEKTTEEMIPLFKTKVNGEPNTKENKLMGQRNWCDFEAETSNDGNDSMLRMNLRVETGKGTGETVSYALTIPPIMKN